MSRRVLGSIESSFGDIVVDEPFAWEEARIGSEADDVIVAVLRVDGSCMQARTSAEPDFEVDARFPCFAISKSDEQIMLLAVLMLNVLW